MIDKDREEIRRVFQSLEDDDDNIHLKDTWSPYVRILQKPNLTMSIYSRREYPL